MAKTKIDKTMEENIMNYASEIRTLSSFVEAVRLRPGMYIGGIGNKGFLNMIREIFQNALDEMMKHDSPCTRIILSYDERNHLTIVQDNGRGIPFDNIIRIFTEQHTGSNFDKKKGEYASGLHGVGSKVSNALSKKFVVESYLNISNRCEARRVEFNDGFPWDKGEIEIPNVDKLQGTMVSFIPTYEVMGNLTLEATTVLDLVKRIIILTNIGSTVEFNGIDLRGNKIHEVIVNEDGIITDIINKTKTPLVKPIMISNDTGEMKADICFTYDFDDLQAEKITSFSNFCPTVAGTHINGFIDGITKFFRTYMNKIYLANSKGKLTIVDSDVKTGLKAIISVSHLEPIFDGQSKETLANEEMHPYVRDLVISSLEQWSKDNPSDMQKVCKYLKDVGDARLKADGEKIKITAKYASSVLTGLPAKYSKPNGVKSDGLEFIVTEGDSAKTGAESSRDKLRQGLFPIRGKLPNAFTTPRAAFLNNEEIAAINRILGVGYVQGLKGYDPDRCDFEKIIFAGDADPDGGHIRTLLLYFFLAYHRPLVERGMIYAAVPPLYGLPETKKGKTSYRYFTNKIDYIKFIQDSFSKTNKVAYPDGKVLSMDELISLFYRNDDYVYDIERLGDIYSIDYRLLELICTFIDEPVNVLNEKVNSEFRFVHADIINNTTVVKGLIGNLYQTVFINEQFRKEVAIIQEYMVKNECLFYKLNDVITSLYNVLKAFEVFHPSSLVRYKGLGEMTASQLGKSTIHPDEQRTLIRYTSQDIIKETNMMRYIDSNRNLLLDGITVRRKDVY